MDKYLVEGYSQGKLSCTFTVTAFSPHEVFCIIANNPNYIRHLNLDEVNISLAPKLDFICEGTKVRAVPRQ